jgi:hypothetical protein
MDFGCPRSSVAPAGDIDALLHDAVTQLVAVAAILASDWTHVLIHYL